jgi:capsule polysaccharide modification protein KpsS
MSKEFKGTSTSQYLADPIIPVIKNTIGKILYFWDVFFKSGNYKKINWSRIIYPNPLKYFWFYAKVDIKRQFLFRSRNFFEDPVKDENYVYMPLHLIPESTTFVKAPFYFNELFIIEEISKSLPIGWKLYVKEHQSMMGERSFEFYNKVKQFPNVRLVKFNFYQDPKPWIENAKGVITITGTGAYESVMLGKKALVFGDVPFNLIEGITRINSFEKLPELIASFGNVDNIKSCAAYLATIKSIGKEINLKYLLSEGEAILRKQNKYSDEYDEQINSLLSFYDNAYEQYETRIGFE